MHRRPTAHQPARAVACTATALYQNLCTPVGRGKKTQAGLQDTAALARKARRRTTRATIKVRRLFSSTTPQFGRRLRHVLFLTQKPIWRKKKKITADEKSHGLYCSMYTTRHAKTKLVYFRRFWMKEPRHLETISDEN